MPLGKFPESSENSLLLPKTRYLVRMAKTSQAIFNKVWRYFIRDKNPQAIDAVGQCMYRGPESNCAIGCQLPNYLYDEKMEEKSIEEVCEGFPKIKKYFGNNLDFLRALQCAHDNTIIHRFYEEFKEELEEIADEYKLKIPKD